MLKILLIRPGTTEFDQQGRILGTLDVPLSAEGNDQVAEVVQQLSDQSLDAIYTSPSESSAQTARRVADGLAVKHKTIDQLRNVNHGLWQGLLVDEVKRKQPKVFRQWQDHPDTVCPPQGEMLPDARSRIESALAKLFKKHKRGVVGIVAPEPLASLIASILRQTELKEVCKPGGADWEVIEVKQPSLITA